MNKCLLDIKLDIIDKARRTAIELGGFQAIAKDTLEIVDANKAAISAKKVNDKFKEDVITPSVTSKSQYFIDPSDSLSQQYLNEYNNKQLAGARQLRQDELDRGVTDDGEGEFYQITSNEIEQADKQLDDHLLNFLKPFGVTSKEVDELKNKLGQDSLGIADVLNKVITIAKDRKIDTVPEEAGHMIVMLMGENHPEIKGLLNTIEKWSGYKAVYDEYWDKYYNEKQIKIEAIGKVLSKAIVKNFKEQAKDSSIFTQARKAIGSFFTALSKLNPFYSNLYTYHLADKIAKNVVLGNTDYVANLTKPNPQLDYSKAIEGNPLGKWIIDTFTNKFKFSLTGSLALAGQGEQVYRPESEPIHDLDFVVNDKSKLEELSKFLNDVNAVPVHYGIKGDDYTTRAYYVPKEGYKLVTTARNNYGWLKVIELVDNQGNKVEANANNVISVDFFVYDIKANQNKPSKFNSWQDIYKGKLSLSRLKSGERMFARPKDQLDYVLSNPVNRDVELAQFTYLQTEDMAASKASKETLELIKNAARQMGVSIQDLADYAKSVGLDTKSINGVADLTRGVIAVAQGMEDVALTEELVHIATAIMEQTNPQLVTSMISKIDRFKIYKTTLDKYKDNKNYQLPNGKPDIRKIKKEAVDKLIAELIVNDSEGSTEFPELMQEENRSLVRVWWDTILDFIRGVYGKSNIDIFQTAAATIATGNVGGTVSDISQEGTFYQIKNDVVNEIYNKFITEANKLTGPFLATATDKRHYKYDGERVAMTVTEKTKGDVPYERTAAQRVQDDMKRDWGSEGHRFLDKFITTNLIDENGYKKPNSEVAIQSTLNPDIQEKLEIFAKNLINSYPPGTRFLIEKKVVNTKVKGMMASTLDFAAIIPQEDGSAKLDILDWKFANIDRAKSEDIPFFKQKEWNAQMNEYTIIANQYGVKTKDIRQARMVPFVTGYNHSIVGDKKSPLVLTTLEVGDPRDPKLNSIYTLPVPVVSELTGNPAVDKLLGALRAQYDKLRKLQVAPEKESTKIRQLEQLSIAIRSLHVKLDFAPLAAVGDTFLRNSAEVIKGFENLNYDTLSADEVKTKLQELLSYENSAKKFTNLDSIFLSQFPKDGLSKEDRDVLASLEHQASVTKRMLGKILDLQKEYTLQLAVKEKIVTKEKARTILDAEKEVGFLARTFSEALDLPAKIIRLGAKLILESQNLINLKVSEILDDFKPKLIALEREAEARGTTAFNMIGKVTDSGLQLIKKIDPEFFKQFNEAKENKDKSFILANINIDQYNDKVKKIIDAEIEDINRTTYTTRSVDENYDKQQLEIKKLRDRLELSRDTFNGYKDYVFDKLFKETMKDELHLSPEYKQMAKSKAALDVWDFFTELNKRARKAGYLDREGNSFFPLIEASLLQKMSQSGSVLGQAKDFFADLYTATEDEEQGLSKIDPETNKIKKEIPKYFKRSRKSVDQLSRDLNKVGTLWVKSLLEYENAKNLENTLLTLQKVENTKGSIVLEGGEIVWEGDMPKVDDSVNKNAAIFEAIINDHLYGLREDLSSLGNISLGNVLGKIIKDEDKKQQKVVSIKKGLRNSDILVQTLAVGLKPLIAVANYFGYNFQAYINAGGRYKFGEFRTNNRKITTGIGLTNEEKALLHLIMPLNESISEEKRREIAKEKGLMDWLGTWSFSDVMMSTNAFPERKLQYANAMSMNENSMVVDGKIVNIRQYVKKQDQKRYKTLDEFERRNLEKTFDARVKALQETSSLEKVVKIEGDKITIPGVSTEELAKYRTTVVEYGRKLNGQMSVDNKAGYRRDSIFSSFMMFKNWIPKQVSLRASDIKKDLVLDEWSYGRTRLFVKTWAQLGTRNIMKMRDIINGTDEGLRILDEMLAAKREEHFKKTGEELTITDEEFYDLVRTELTNELKELQLLIGTMALILAAGAAVPDDDDTLDAATRNRYKYILKAMNKIEDELSFYYKPTSMESMTRGSILPSLGMLSKVEKLIANTVNETYGYVSDDPKMMDKAHPLKYFFNLVPGFAQVQSEILPTFFPELAKEQDIRVSAESRMR